MWARCRPLGCDGLEAQQRTPGMGIMRQVSRPLYCSLRACTEPTAGSCAGAIVLGHLQLTSQP